MSDFPYLYPYFHTEATHQGKTQMCEDSFLQNVGCARAIEQAIRDHFDESNKGLKEGCARSILAQYGFKRVNFVLANSLKEMGCK